MIGLDVNSGKSIEAEIDYASAMSKAQRDTARRELSAAAVQS